MSEVIPNIHPNFCEETVYSPHERGQLGSVEVPETEDSVRYSVQAILPESQFDTGVS